MVAAYFGHQEVVSHLLCLKADVNYTTKCGNTALHFAAEAGCLGIIENLQQFGATLRPTQKGTFRVWYQ